jgi:hypothetical protein
MRQMVRALMIGAASALALAVASTGAQAQMSIFSNFFGVQEDTPAINYSERPPLVLPKKRELASPADSADAGFQSQQGEWPNDPDEIKRRKLKDKAGLMPAGDTSAPLSPDQLRAVGNNPQAVIDERTAKLDALNATGAPLPPDVLRSQKFRGLTPIEEPLVAGQEPTRRSLVDPPPGLRVPVASAPVDGSGELPSEIAAKGKSKGWFDWFN